MTRLRPQNVSDGFKQCHLKAPYVTEKQSGEGGRRGEEGGGITPQGGRGAGTDTVGSTLTPASEEAGPAGRLLEIIPGLRGRFLAAPGTPRGLAVCVCVFWLWPLLAGHVVPGVSHATARATATVLSGLRGDRQHSLGTSRQAGSLELDLQETHRKLTLRVRDRVIKAVTSGGLWLQGRPRPPAVRPSVLEAPGRAVAPS